MVEETAYAKSKSLEGPVVILLVVWDGSVLGNENRAQSGHRERKIMIQHKSCWSPGLVATNMLLALWASPVDIPPQVSPECHGTSSVTYRINKTKKHHTAH